MASRQILFAAQLPLVLIPGFSLGVLPYATRFYKRQIHVCIYKYADFE